MENVTPIVTPGGDALLDALVALTRLHHKPFSAESLSAGLPLENGLFTPALFERAAERAGFSARHLSRDLADIPAQVLPVALVLEHNQTCLLLGVNGETAEVLLPADAEAPQSLPLARLEQMYAGECFYIKPDYDYITETGEQTRDKHWFWSTVKRSIGLYGEVILASLFINMFALVSPLFIMNVYDRVVPNYAVETLWVLASGVFIVFMFDLAMKSLRGYFIDVAGKRADIMLSSRTFARVMDIRMSHRPTRVGSFANNLQEFDAFREFFTSTTMTALIDVPFVLLFITLIMTIGGVLAIIPLTAIPLIILVSFAFQRPLQRTIEKSFAESSRKHAMLIETLSGLDAVKASRAEGVMQRKWEEYNARLARLGLRSRLLSLSTVNFAQAIQQISTVTMVVAGVYRIMDAELSVGGLIACTILTGRSLAPMAQVASILSRYHQSMAAYSAIDRVMQLPVERPEGRKFLHRPRLDGNLTFRDAGFAYPGSQANAIKGVNLDINTGEKVGIIGRMGSGKSTLQKLLMGFYAPQEGSILMAGTDINQLDPTDLRRNITYVPQDVVLFDGTIRENIVMGAPLADDAAVLRAAELAGLAEFVNQHPEGFDLQVGERGANLSGGQRQAVAIARAFVVASPLLLLDEPTNSMDSTTENLFKSRLQQYASDKTLLLVTHKTSLLSLVDRLIVMHEGQVVADGARDEVLRSLAGEPRT